MPDHAATVGAIYQAFGQGNIPAILEHLADDVQWEHWADNHAQRVDVPWLRPRSGKQGALEFFQVVGGLTFNDFRVLSIMAGGNQVAAELLVDFDVPSSGGHLRDEEMHLWTFNDVGKVTRLRHYIDTAKHIAAARGGR